ncbi:MAG: IclR family transcriptional regulator [Aggregatilineales bacterium]
MASDCSSTKPTVVPALEKALDILEYIAERGTVVTIKEITTSLGIPLASSYRIVNYLCSRGYLKTQGDGEFYLGPQLLYLSHRVEQQFDLINQAKPIMNALATESGQTAQLGVLQDFGVVYIEQALPSKPVNIVAALRTVIPVNLSASGKVLVAHLPQQEQDYFLKNAKLVQQTPNSIVDLDAFRRELAQVREQGYALDHEEYARGIGCAAAPIWDYRGQVIAAIGITGRIDDYTNESNLRRVIELVLSAAQDISRKTGSTRHEDRIAAGS